MGDTKEQSTCAEHSGMCEKIINIKDDTSEMKEMLKKWDSRIWALMVSLLLTFIGWAYTANQRKVEAMIQKAGITKNVNAQDSIRMYP